MSKLKRIISDFHAQPDVALRPRALEVPLDLGKIAVITGPRRAGKTYYLFQLMGLLRAQGVDPRDIVYVNFEDERLDLRGDHDQILDAWRELYPERDIAGVYLFFDEIQALDDWQRYVRRLHDSVTRHIFLTGSNARLLSQEIATALRGRCLSFELLPLSFREFLDFVGVKAEERDSSAARAQIEAAFERYLIWGGFPELVEIEERFRPAVLQEYFNVMMFLDIAERYAIRDVQMLRYIIKRLLSSFTKEYSVNKLYNELRSQGQSIGKDGLYRITEQIFSVYMMVSVEKYDPAVVRRSMSNKKIYLIDNGFASVVDYTQAEDFGKLLENLVYRHLRASAAEIFFARNGWECDFISLAPSRPPRLVQVTNHLGAENFKREIKGLIEAGKKLPDADRLLLYRGVEPDLPALPDDVEARNVVDWLLDEAA